MDTLAIAQIAYEVNRGYCEALGDNSQFSWVNAPQCKRDNTLDRVNVHIFHNHSVEVLHTAWMTQMKANGWVFGEEKDPERKTHPCMVPFDELPTEEQAKNYIFYAVVRALRDHLDDD